MLSRFLVCVTAASLVLTSCATPYKKKDEEKKKVETGEKIKDQSDDTSFQAFLGRLRTAVNHKDRVTLTSMMTPDFGYRWDPAPAGETPFDYWDQNNLWPEVQSLLHGKFVPHETYMVAPPEVETDPTYRGYRAGLRTVTGSWKFAYFVAPEEPGQ